MKDDVWVAIDTKTNRIVAFDTDHGVVQKAANQHYKLSKNSTKLRTLKVGMIVYEG